MTGVAMHHEVSGPSSAPPVVLSSSLGTTLAMWDPQMRALAARLRVIRYDHRGHGKSPTLPGPYALSDLGGDVLTLLDALAIERASFCGLSLGGMVGMWLAAHAPDRVARLALVSTSAQLGPASMWEQRVAAVRESGTGSIADTVVGRWFTAGFVAAHPEVVADHREMIEAAADDGYAACCAAITHMDLRADLVKITAPTLVIAAAEDPATPPAHAYEIAARVGSARLEVVAGAAHLVNVEQPAVVTQLLLDHFSP